ncbi:4TM region of DNA translocase FtsK/SpoIIIE [Brevinema andersonii]|uniref:4TM region of DNA translocase FtsK/SpoIIIE n=1 Tax=Brevinema andersonii TaxID=34097 RepID=A0A1I1D4F6_BREAD|nr:DNA translocase FtsK [Brevinema andersonii]SFB67670.1 4TM region of DNA translocase FtsK/SpoIIIE [Brevinema andersonii]
MIRAIISYSLIIFSLILSIALATFSPNDVAGLSSSTNIHAMNWLGIVGAQIAEAFILFYGQASWLWVLFSLIIGLRLIFGIFPKTLLNYFFSTQYLSILTAICLSCIYGSESYLKGGIFGAMVYQALKSIFPDTILQTFFWIMLIVSVIALWKFPHTLWKKFMTYRRAAHQQKQWDKAEEWIYVDKQPVEIFEEPIEHHQEDQTFYLNKKRLTRPEEPSFLRDVDVDLTDSYKNPPNPFYDVLEENRLELDDMPEIHTEYTVPPDSLDELENVKVFRIPAVERNEEHQKYMPQLPDDYNRTEDFVKPAHKTIRLSLDKGFIDTVEYEQESERHLKNKEADIRRTETRILELDNELYVVDTPAKACNDVLISNVQYMKTLSLSDNDVAFDKLIAQKEILLDEYGFYKGEKFSQNYSSTEEIADPYRLILPEIFESPDQDIFHSNAGESRELTEAETQLINNLDHRNQQKIQQKNAFQEKIRRKQQELADQYHQLYMLDEQEKNLISQLESELRAKFQHQQELREKLHKKQQELAELYHSQQPIQGEVIFDMLTEQIDEQLTHKPNVNFSIFDDDAVEELGDEIRLLKGNDKISVSESEVQEIPISVFDDFFLEQDKIPISIPEYNFTHQEFDDAPADNETTVPEPIENVQISKDLLDEMIMPEPSDDMPTLDEIADTVDTEEIEIKEEDIIETEEETADFEEGIENTVSSFEDEDLDLPASAPPRDWEKVFTYEPTAPVALEFENELIDNMDTDISEDADRTVDDIDQNIIQELEDDPIEINEADNITESEDEAAYEEILFDDIQSSIEDQEEDVAHEFSKEKHVSPWENVDLHESEIVPIVIESVEIGSLEEKFNIDEEKESIVSADSPLMVEEIPNLIPEISDLDQNEAALLPRFTTQSYLVATDEYPVDHSLGKPIEIVFPKVEDLDPNLEIVFHELEDDEIEETIRMIEDTFESFNIRMKVVDYSRGPAITRFELEPPPGLKLRTIRNLQDDLALQAGTSNIRIISPVEGRSYIGIEVPNKIRRQFLLRQFIESSEFQQSDAALPLILGTDIGGKVLVSDLATTPHLLVAGTTGSGKSVYINALIMGLLFKLSADDLKFIMIDPKMVELELYNGIPHLLAPIITKPEEAMASLEWAVNEMDRRYKILSENGVRNIKEYQSLVESSLFGAEESGYEKLPYIVIIIDEFANLMLRSPKDTEKNISRLAAMARAVGMHLVVATQRPSVDVVTGVIKANFPCRVAFRVSSKIDSRTILDKNGAEALLGRGDMLFMSPEHMDTVRIQSPYVSGHDVETVVSAVKKNGPPNYAIDFEELLSANKDSIQDGSKTDALTDPLFAEVLRYAVDSGEISASAIQRRFRVGYNRASRLIETMKDLNIVMPPVSAGKGWQVLISKDQIADYIDF